MPPPPPVELPSPEGPGDGGTAEAPRAAEEATPCIDAESCRYGSGAAGAPPPAAGGGGGPGQRFPVRWQIGVIGFLMEVVCYADRTLISLGIIEMEEHYGWGSSVQGIVLSAFFAGYACTQVFGGWAAERYGAKPVLGWGVFWWSVLTIVTPPAADVGIVFLIAVRVLLGMAEGVALPCMHHLTACWVPQQERSRFVTLCTSGQTVGTLSAMLSAPLVERNWRIVFYIFGAAGLLWNVLWYFRGASTPEEHVSIRRAELDYIHEHRLKCRASHTGDTWPRILGFLRQPCFIAIATAHFCNNWTYYLLLSWLPEYYTSELDIELGESGLMLVVPYAVPFIAINCVGQLADALTYRCGMRLVNVRKSMQAVSTIAPSFCLFGLMISGGKLSPASATALITVCQLFMTFSSCGYWANMIDVASSRHVALLLGVSNTLASIPGFVGNVATGFILDSTGDNWTIVWILAIVFYMIGVTTFTALARADLVFP